MDSRFSMPSEGGLFSLCFSHQLDCLGMLPGQPFGQLGYPFHQGPLAAFLVGIHTWPGTFAWSWDHVTHRAFPACHMRLPCRK
jgi:hypothetical protein